MFSAQAWSDFHVAALPAFLIANVLLDDLTGLVYTEPNIHFRIGLYVGLVSSAYWWLVVRFCCWLLTKWLDRRR